MLIIKVIKTQVRGRASCGHNIPAKVDYFITAIKGVLKSKCIDCCPQARVEKTLTPLGLREFK